MPHKVFVKDTVSGACGLADPPCELPGTANPPITGNGTSGNPWGIDCSALKALCALDQEMGPAVIATGTPIDPADTATWPALATPHKKQCVYDAAGNLIGVIDAAGAHPIAAGSAQQIATQAEVDAGTNAANVVTPSTFRHKGLHYKHTGTLAVPNNTLTLLTTVTDLIRNDLGGFAAGVFTAANPGWYLTSLRTSFPVGNAYEFSNIIVAPTGGGIAMNQRDLILADPTQTLNATANTATLVTYLSAGDQLNIYVQQKNVAGVTINLQLAEVAIVHL